MSLKGSVDNIIFNNYIFISHFLHDTARYFEESYMCLAIQRDEPKYHGVLGRKMPIARPKPKTKLRYF